MQEINIETALQMRARYFPSESQQPYNGQNDYLSYLASKGVTLNPKLFPSVFRLKNGLPYIGMAVKDTLVGGQVLIRVPQQLILSSAKAAQQPMLSEVFKDKFFVNDEHTWQDRVLIVYSLFLLQQKDEQNPWYQMVKRLPKQCDIACFWSEDEINKFKQQSIKTAALKDLKSFEAEWAQFQIMQSKYAILQSQQYNKQNYKTIFANEINRSFGGTLSFVSLVPFAQLCNHHCSKVFFVTQKTKETFFEKDQDLKSEQSSTGSCSSEEYIEQQQFAYDKIDSTSFNWTVKESYELSNKQKAKVQKQSTRLLDFIDKNLNWQNFTVRFVGQPMLKIKVIVNQYLVGRKTFQKTMQQLQIMNKTILSYKQKVEAYFQTVNHKSYYGKKEKKQENQVKAVDFKYPVPKHQYQNLIIRASKKDRFQKNSQIYFRYGPNSNRTLLLHYGFAIEGNKYEHVWISLKMNKYFSEFPDVLDKIMEKKSSLLRKFKMYNHRLNIDLIIFLRLKHWTFYGEKSVEQIFTVSSFQKQISVLEEIVLILTQKLKKYEGTYDLTDKSLNYHQYFIAVYHKEIMTILRKQIYLHNKLIEILCKLTQGISYQEATFHLSQAERSILKHYIESIKL